MQWQLLTRDELLQLEQLQILDELELLELEADQASGPEELGP